MDLRRQVPSGVSLSTALMAADFGTPSGIGGQALDVCFTDLAATLRRSRDYRYVPVFSDDIRGSDKRRRGRRSSR
jgi:hypothetical protein